MKKSIKKNLYGVAIGLCAIAMFSSFGVLVTAKPEKTKPIKILAGNAGVVLSTIGMAVADKRLRKLEKERN